MIADKESLTVLWVKQFSEEFAGKVLEVSQEEAVALVCDRRAQAEKRKLGLLTQYQHGFQSMPSTVDGWFDALQARLSKAKKGQQVGLECISN